MTKARSYSVVQVHEPAFLSRHVFVKLVPPVILVPSGMVTSLTNSTQLHGKGVGVGGIRVAVGGTLVAVGGTTVTTTVGIGVFVGGIGVLVGTTGWLEVAVGASGA